ncbi:uncharacterized protein PAC_18792 [Phialocephala subalpina]|uniref:Uncharacterized protein n=1 Tax=Phialocephala subalpina TaxID=576137 RepID=A0A1L7XV27_9HELO|nr:uncharacterized protein PAC_18792 [Phialocephala subalpina]
MELSRVPTTHGSIPSTPRPLRSRQTQLQASAAAPAAASNASNHASLTTTEIAIYGIDNVSGFFGPGAWAAWILIAASFCIDRLYKKTEHEDVEGSIFSGLDPNLFAAFSYSSIAAVDLLIRLRHHTSPHDLLKNSGSLVATVAVVKLGAGLGILLCVICLWCSRKEQPSTLAKWYYLLSTAFMIVVVMVFDVIYQGVVLGPYEFGATFLFLQRPFEHYNTRLGQLVQEKLIGELLLGVFAKFLVRTFPPVVTFFLYLVYIMLASTHSFAPDRPQIVPNGVHIVISLYIFRLLFFGYEIWVGFSIPRTTAPIMDLDQFSALILTGVFPLLGTVAGLLRQYQRSETKDDHGQQQYQYQHHAMSEDLRDTAMALIGTPGSLHPTVSIPRSTSSSETSPFSTLSQLSTLPPTPPPPPPPAI